MPSSTAFSWWARTWAESGQVGKTATSNPAKRGIMYAIGIDAPSIHRARIVMVEDPASPTIRWTQEFGSLDDDLIETLAGLPDGTRAAIYLLDPIGAPRDRIDRRLMAVGWWGALLSMRGLPWRTVTFYRNLQPIVSPAAHRLFGPWINSNDIEYTHYIFAAIDALYDNTQDIEAAHNFAEALVAAIHALCT